MSEETTRRPGSLAHDVMVESAREEEGRKQIASTTLLSRRGFVLCTACVREAEDRQKWRRRFLLLPLSVQGSFFTA